MNKYYKIALILIIALSIPCSLFANQFKSGKSFSVISTGALQEISVPYQSHCKTFRINVHDGNASNFSHEPIEFHYTFNSDGSDWDWATGAIFPLDKTEGVLIYIDTGTAGQTIAITMLE